MPKRDTDSSHGHRHLLALFPLISLCLPPFPLTGACLPLPPRHLPPGPLVDLLRRLPHRWVRGLGVNGEEERAGSGVRRRAAQDWETAGLGQEEGAPE